MKKITLSLLAVALSGASAFSQVTSIITAPNTISGSTSGRAPNGNAAHTTFRSQYNIPASALTGLGSNIVSFGFDFDSGVATAATGSITIYLQNSTNSTYTMGTTWNVTGMTQVYTGAYSLPLTNNTTLDITLPSNFPYTGGALNVAIDYIGQTYDPTYAAYYNAYQDPNSVVWGAYAASTSPTSPTTLANTAIIPLYRFGYPNTVTNDIQVVRVIAPGKLPKNNAQTVEAEIKNISNTAISTISVGLAVTGANTYVDLQTIPTLAAGASIIVSFNAFTPATQGAETVSVSLLPDQNLANNTATVSQNITCEVQTNNPLLANSAYATGLGYTSSLGYFVKRFTTASANSVKAMNIAIGSETVNIGKQIYGAVIDATGNVLATTNTITISNATAGTFQRFDFATSQAVAAGDFYLGTAQTTASTYPIGTAAANFASDRMYTLVNGNMSAITSNVGYFGMEAIYTTTAPAIGATSTRSVLCKGESAVITATGAATYTWSSPAATTTSISVSPTVTTVYSVSATDANGCTNKAAFTQSVNACTGLMVNAANGAEIKLFPNPAVSGKSTLSGLNGMNKIVVYNILGQSISSVISSEESITIDLANQPNGTYLVKITDESNNSKTVKIVNQN